MLSGSATARWTEARFPQMMHIRSSILQAARRPVPDDGPIAAARIDVAATADLEVQRSFVREARRRLVSLQT